jgi:hypothetical protein
VAAARLPCVGVHPLELTVTSVRPTLQVVGRRLDPEHYELRDFLTRIAQPHEWRHGSTKRVAGAVGDGAMFAALVHRRLEELERERS